MNDAISKLIRGGPEGVNVDLVVVLDWQDGPREGYLSLTQPESAWSFRLIASRFDPDGLDDLLFLWRPLPWRVWQDLTLSLASSQRPQSSTWVPTPEIWDGVVSEALGEALRAPLPKEGLVVRAKNVRQPLELWRYHD